MDVVSAIADPVRREILSLLKRGPLTAGSIAAEFDISRPAISRHLRILREHGLVHDEIQGRERFYQLDISPLAPVGAWLTQLGNDWSPRLDALETEVFRTRREGRTARGTPTSTPETSKERTA